MEKNGPDESEQESEQDEGSKEVDSSEGNEDDASEGEERSENLQEDEEIEGGEIGENGEVEAEADEVEANEVEADEVEADDEEEEERDEGLSIAQQYSGKQRYHGRIQHATKLPQMFQHATKRKPRKEKKPTRNAYKWLKEIRQYQKSTDAIIPYLPFQKLVRGIAAEMEPGMINLRFQKDAILCLREALESYGTKYFDAVNVVALGSRRTTVLPRDSETLKKLKKTGFF